MKHLKIAFLFFVFCILLNEATFAQQAPAITWQHCFGGLFGDWAHSITRGDENIDDEYVIAAFTYSHDGDVSCSDGRKTGWVISIGQSGIYWQKCLGGSRGAEIRSIIKTSDGGYAVAGSTLSNDGDVSGNHGGNSDPGNGNFGGGGGDAWVVKLDNNGNILWQKCFGGSGIDEAFSIIESKDEGKDLIIAGITNSSDGDVSGWHTDTTKGNGRTPNFDAWVVRMSSTGTIRWQKCIGGSGDDQANAIIQTSDGGFAIAGSTTSNDGDVSGNHGGRDSWIVKLNATGNIQWQKCFGGSSTEEAYSILQAADSGYVIAGYTRSNNGDVSGNHIPLTIGSYYNDNDTSDVWLVKISSSGSLQWQKCLGGSYWDIAYSIIQTSGGDYIVSGLTNSNDGDVRSYSGSGGTQQWILRLSDIGVLRWEKCYGGRKTAGGEGPSPIIKTSDGGYVFAGSTSSNDGDVSGNHGSINGTDVWVVKLDPDTMTASVQLNYSNDFISNNVKIYPNPSYSETHFVLNSNFAISGTSFYDIMGRQQFPPYTLDNNIVSFDVHDFPSGIYLARLAVIGDLILQSTFTLPFIVQH